MKPERPASKPLSFIDSLLTRSRHTFTLAEAIEALGTSPAAVKAALGRMTRKKLIASPAKGFYVIVFPEGTRVPPGEKRRYKPGGAYLATHVGCKVVPIAHNAGELWPRQAFLKQAGTVTISIGPAFDATGLSEAEVNRRAEQWIEAEMHRIAPHRYSDVQHNAT